MLGQARREIGATYDHRNGDWGDTTDNTENCQSTARRRRQSGSKTFLARSPQPRLTIRLERIASRSDAARKKIEEAIPGTRNCLFVFYTSLTVIPDLILPIGNRKSYISNQSSPNGVHVPPENSSLVLILNFS
jgi:hypothetical protein